MNLLSWLATIAFSFLLYRTLLGCLDDLCHQRTHSHRLEAKRQRVRHEMARVSSTGTGHLMLQATIEEGCAEWVDQEFSSLLREARLIRELAPIVGIMFTSTGLVALMYKQSQFGVSDQLQMFSDMSVALVTTALGSTLAGIQMLLIHRIEKRKACSFKRLCDTLGRAPDHTAAPVANNPGREVRHAQ